MNYKTTTRIFVCLALCWAVLNASLAGACSVPVFRYALERWASDTYEVVIFHRGELSTELRAVVKSLGPEGQAGKKFANVAVRTIDLDAEPAEELVEFWNAQKTETLPWMVVRSPKPFPDIWSGPPSQDVVGRLLDSPIRREIARRVLKGATAVWVLLESGDKQKDEAAYQTLESRLKYEPSVLKLPEIDQQDIADGLVSVEPDELKISFSVIRLSRKDPAEKMLLEMLLGSEWEEDYSLRDAEVVNQPMAFPIFGRGRVLYALIGGGINDEVIHMACETLVGACTCTVKSENPGTDIIMSVDWDRLVETQIEIDKELPPLMGLGSFAGISLEETNGPADQPDEIESKSPTVQVAATPVSTEKPAAVTSSTSSVLRNTMILIGISVVAVFGLSLFFVARKS
jgi:hypothetical protein